MEIEPEKTNLSKGDLAQMGRDSQAAARAAASAQRAAASARAADARREATAEKARKNAEAAAEEARKKAEAPALATREKAKDAAQERLQRINDGDLQARIDAGDLMIDMPAPSDFSRGSHDPIAALHLLHYNTGLAGNEALAALHELKYCNLTDEQRAEETQAARAALDREREDSEKAQDGIRKAYVGRVNEARIFYVCACCGERNDEGVGQYQLFTQERLEPLRYTGSAEDVERWGRIERAHALVDGPRVWSCDSVNVSTPLPIALKVVQEDVWEAHARFKTPRGALGTKIGQAGAGARWGR